MTRREWFEIVGAMAIAPSDEPGTRLPLGFSLYGMKSLKLADAVKLCGEIGYDGIELAAMPGWPGDPTELRDDARKTLCKQLIDAKLDLHGIMENLPQPTVASEHAKNLSRLKAAAELGNAVSPGGQVVIETILGGKPADWPQIKGKLVENLGDWAEVGKNAKVVIAVKPHVANALHTVEDALWLVKQVKSPWLRLAFDHSHFELRGVKPTEAAAALAPFSAFTHVKDAKGSAEKFEFLLPGDGGTDYSALATALAKAGYRSPVVVEVSGMLSNKTGYDPEAAARKCFANLSKVFGTQPRK